jgi:outer membrane protein assembly factor BamB
MRRYVLLASILAACNAPSLPLQSGSPWPKFRANAAQDGATAVKPQPTGGTFFDFQTAKGIFSSPVIAADGTIYIGSADRTFYALAPDGSVKWKLLTDEIIDSSALLDDEGRVYFGSGDGFLRALDAKSGDLVWKTAADPPSVNAALINWFEGNVAIAPSGMLYVPNDNWFVYGVDRATGAITERLRVPDQTWSLPAVDVQTGNFFVGNNNVVEFLGSNLFAFDKKGAGTWDKFVSVGSIAASPMLTPEGLVVVGGFDGFVRAYDPKSGDVRWEFGTRDHLYASPSRLPDGTIVQASTDGTIYALDPKTGTQKWAYDTRDPIRSSPSVDGAGNLYFGSGDGRMYVLNPDGTLRWSIQLIMGDRNDVNASPALGKDAVYIAGESGEVFSIPYDWCLRDAGKADPRCAPPAVAELPADGGMLLATTEFGSERATPPTQLDPNQPLVLSLVVRAGGHDTLAVLDPSAVQVAFEPAADVTTEVAGNGRFLTITPNQPLTAAADGTVGVTVTAGTLVGLDRAGLKLSGGTPGAPVTTTFRAMLTPANPSPVALQVPNGVWEVSRLALPLPTILPSYNQIGFDSLHYLVGLVEGSNGHAVAWMAGARLASGENRTEIDPATRALFPLDVSYAGGFITLANQDGVSVEVMNAVIPFRTFRMAAALGADGSAAGPLRMTGSTICGYIAVYGLFLQKLGLCNAKTDVLSVSGAAQLTKFTGATPPDPTAVGTVAFASAGGAVTATITGGSLKTADHVAGILLVDAATGKPVTLDYGLTTQRSSDASGLLTSVSIPIAGKTVPPMVRAYLMVDVFPAANATLSVP